MKIDAKSFIGRISLGHNTEKGFLGVCVWSGIFKLGLRVQSYFFPYAEVIGFAIDVALDVGLRASIASALPLTQAWSVELHYKRQTITSGAFNFFHGGHLVATPKSVNVRGADLAALAARIERVGKASAKARTVGPVGIGARLCQLRALAALLGAVLHDYTEFI